MASDRLPRLQDTKFGDGPLPARFAADTLHFTPAAYETLNVGLLQEFNPE